MRIGFIQAYSDTHDIVNGIHNDSESIPDLYQYNYVELPSDMALDHSKLILVDKQTKDITIVDSATYKLNTIELLNYKQTQILKACYNDIYGQFKFQGNQFACDATARDDINDLYYASQKDNFVSRYWFTLGGESVILITKELVVPFKDAVVQWKDDCWNKYAILSNQLKAIDLESEDAREQIEAINW